jgi:hypothetical protein
MLRIVCALKTCDTLKRYIKRKILRRNISTSFIRHTGSNKYKRSIHKCKKERKEKKLFNIIELKRLNILMNDVANVKAFEPIKI